MLYEELLGTDFSKFDMTIWFVYVVSLVIVNRWAHADEKEECLAAIKDIDESVMKHCDGITMKVKGQQYSGQPGTSFINTIINAMVSWYAAGCPEDYFNYGGAGEALRCSGDDKIVGRTTAARELDACAFFGLVLKIETFGNILDLAFLSRYYYLDHNGDIRSHCDFYRLLKKIHLSSKFPGLRFKELLVSKYLSILASDYNTPFISALAYFMVTTYGEPGQQLRLKYGIDLAPEDILSRGPPPFNTHCAASLAKHCGLNVGNLREWHEQAAQGMVTTIPGANDPSLQYYLSI